MNNVHALPNQHAIYDEASLWIARLDRQLSAEEAGELQAWMMRSEQHREVLFAMAELWDRMDSLQRLAALFPVSHRPRRLTWLRYGAAAASLLVMLFAGLWMMGGLRAAPPSLVAGAYETGVGERSTVNLPDGSQLVINTNSAVSVQYTKAARMLVLERGELHINVAHDTERPLRIFANNKMVQAVGTAFNVAIINEREVDLIVTDGKVLVAERDPQIHPHEAPPAQTAEPLTLSKGEKIRLGSPDAKINKMTQPDIEARLSWRQGNLIFHGETLEEALAEIARYTEVRFDIRDESIRQVRIAGMFRAGDVDGLLYALEQNFSIQHERLTEDRVALKRQL